MATAMRASNAVLSIPQEVELVTVRREDRSVEIEEIELPTASAAAMEPPSSAPASPAPLSDPPAVPWHEHRVEPPPQRQLRPRQTLWARMKSVRITVVCHWVLSWCSVFLFFSAIIDNDWRYFHVNRDALLLLHRSGEISAELLNMTIAHTRSHTIYTECILDAEYSVINGSSLYYQPGCHSILAELRLRPESKRTIAYLIMTLMFISPLMIFLALTSMSFLAIAYCTKDFRSLILLLITIFRLLNTVFCVVMIMCASAVGYLFQRTDPSYPLPWPRLIRESTVVYFLQPGMIDCIAGMLAQLAALFLDVYEARKARNYTTWTATVSFESVLHRPGT